MIACAPWDLAAHLPWQPLKSPLQQWAAQPSFLVGEYAFIACAAIALVHARACGRRHVLAWVAALLAGTANDLFFMALPLVDNFWQAQATIMITPRLPLYIPCVYVCFMYVPTVAVWRLGLPPLAAAAASGLAAMIFYAPYDIVGAKFLWWTWHDSDLPIANRLFGAPVGSTMWVVTFVAAFAWLLTRGLRRDPGVGARTFAGTLALVAGLATPTMMVQLTVLQQLDGGVPGVRGLVVVVVGYALVVAHGWRRRTSGDAPVRADRLLRGAVLGHFAMLVAVMALFEPQMHVATGVHQTYGPCGVEATDITGKTRYEYLCAADFDEEFRFDCVDSLPADGSEWYTLCGTPHRSSATAGTVVPSLGVFGALLFAGLLRRRR